MNDVHQGRCISGAVRYRTTGKPFFGTVCHCTFCQRRLAGAFAVLVSFHETAVEVTQGRLSEYEHRSDVSGRWLRIQFCPKCGTTVSHTAEFRPAARTVTGGTFDDPDWFTVNRHIWVKSKRPWATIPPGVEVYAEGYSASSPPSGP
jgi:hypothetical protein